MSHANAALTPRARLRLARLIVDQGWRIARAAERYDVSWPTAKRWAERYQVIGAEGMDDRSSRPHRQPGRTPAPVVRKIVHLRWKQRLGPVAIGIVRSDWAVLSGTRASPEMPMRAGQSLGRRNPYGQSRCCSRRRRGALSSGTGWVATFCADPVQASGRRSRVELGPVAADDRSAACPDPS
jgi:hypothetical protein